MKYISVIIGLIVSLNCYSQTYYLINDDFNKEEYINYDNNTINFDSKRFDVGFSLKGNSFESFKVSYETTLLVRGNNNLHLILTQYISGMWKKITFVEGDYETVKKELLKLKLGKKTNIKHTEGVKEGETDLGKFEFISELIFNMKKSSYEKEMKSKQYEQNYITQTKLEDYIGTYKFKLIYHSDYKVDCKGVMYVTEEGITIKCEDIISLQLVRSSHNKSFPKDNWDEGSFYCKINKGYGNDLMVVINKKTNSVGITTTMYKTTTTSSGTILDIIK